MKKEDFFAPEHKPHMIMENELKPGDTFESSEGFGLLISTDKAIILKQVGWGYNIKSKSPPSDSIRLKGESLEEPVRLAFDCVCETLGLPCT